MDSTTTIYYCKCGCGTEIQRTGHPNGGYKLYVNDDHVQFYRRNRKLEIEKEALKQGWSVNEFAVASKFFELWGKENVKCDICEMKYKENLDTWNLPMSAILKLGIRNYKVLQKESWNFYCLKCYVEITFIKENTI